jgi:hypothetical protein
MDATHSPDRAVWRLAVAEIAAKAHTKLPNSTGRIDSAVKIVLAGDVELLPAGGARVAIRTDATGQYHFANGHCDCRDYARAPGNLCAHRLAYGIARRAAELLPPSPEPLRLPPVPTVPLPEAPASVNVHLIISGRQVQLTLRDNDEGHLLARLEAVLQRFPLPPAEASGQSQGKDWCSKHHVQMKLTQKDGRSWYSHRTAEGWCTGR